MKTSQLRFAAASAKNASMVMCATALSHVAKQQKKTKWLLFCTQKLFSLTFMNKYIVTLPVAGFGTHACTQVDVILDIT